jgi:hypothetical protein
MGLHSRAEGQSSGYLHGVCPRQACRSRSRGAFRSIGGGRGSHGQRVLGLGGRLGDLACLVVVEIGGSGAAPAPILPTEFAR